MAQRAFLSDQGAEVGNPAGTLGNRRRDPRASYKSAAQPPSVPPSRHPSRGPDVSTSINVIDTHPQPMEEPMTGGTTCVRMDEDTTRGGFVFSSTIPDNNDTVFYT